MKAHDLDENEKVIAPLEKTMGDRFQMSWATLVSKAHPEGQWASAYHIKVAVRDGSTFWLSSGNWQSSNQPDVHPFTKPPGPLPPSFQRKYNRDYHAIIENKTLASAYETYIKRDYELTKTRAEAESFALPDLFVPEEEEEAVEFAEPPQFFPPLRRERQFKVQPLLTPDNYAEHALELIQSAKESVWFQNQYINFKNTGEDFPIFKRLIGALKKQVDKKRDVRIICRDMMKQESVDVLIALGFPRELMRFQPACHNKTIIVDGKRRHVRQPQLVERGRGDQSRRQPDLPRQRNRGLSRSSLRIRLGAAGHGEAGTAACSRGQGRRANASRLQAGAVFRRL